MGNKVVTARFTDDELVRLDALRGEVSRSDFIRGRTIGDVPNDDRRSRTRRAVVATSVVELPPPMSAPVTRQYDTVASTPVRPAEQTRSPQVAPRWKAKP